MVFMAKADKYNKLCFCQMLQTIQMIRASGQDAESRYVIVFHVASMKLMHSLMAC